MAVVVVAVVSNKVRVRAVVVIGIGIAIVRFLLLRIHTVSGAECHRSPELLPLLWCE
jgi:hypothetical protein